MKGKDLPNKFWVEAVNIAIFILNRSRTKTVQNKTPYEAWYGQKPQAKNLKVFGCITYALIPSQNREKFDKKGEKYIFIGYSEKSKAYNLLNQRKMNLLFLEMFFLMSWQHGSEKKILLMVREYLS